MTTGVINGTDFRLYLAANVIAYATSCTLSGSTEIRETIHKDNPGSGDREIQLGQKSATITCEAFLNTDGINNSSVDLFDLWQNRTSVTWLLSTETAGDTSFTGSGYITSIEKTAGVEENGTVSLTIEVDGSITTAVIV